MPKQLSFTKMQGVGNDFVVIDGRNYSDFDWSGLAIEICDRHLGVGADGLIVLDSSHLADIMMRMYNPDGTPDVCGNGLRCVSRFAVERKIVPSKTLRVATLAGVRTASLLPTQNNEPPLVTIGMGQPRLNPADIPMRITRENALNFPLQLDGEATLTITALSTGSTHTVIFVDSLPDDINFLRLSAKIEHHPLFPDRTSIMWCRVDGPNRFQIRIWERGAGETWGCGTGACAAAVAGILLGCAVQENIVTVVSRGGELKIKWNQDAEIEMTGPAEYVFEGLYTIPA